MQVNYAGDGLFGEEMDKLAGFLEAMGFNLISMIVSAIFGYLIIGNMVKQIKIALLASSMDNAIVNFILTLVRFLLLLGLLLLCLSELNIPLTGVIGAISAATLAIGLALKDILSSVANGIMLVLNSPFKANEYVEIGGVGGTIKEVRLMHTVMNTPDNKLIMIPNSQVFSSTITNYSVNDFRRMDISVDADYDEEPEKVRKILLDVANSHPLVCGEPAPSCHYNYSKNSVINYGVRVWCRNSDYWTVNWALNEQLTKALMEKGIKIPFPQITVSYRKEASK